MDAKEFNKRSAENILHEMKASKQGKLSDLYWETTVIEAMEFYANIKVKESLEEIKKEIDLATPQIQSINKKFVIEIINSKINKL
jgi:hypothetical protein